MKKMTCSLLVGLALLISTTSSAAVGDSILLGEYIFTESNDLEAKNVATGLTLSDLELSEVTGLKGLKAERNTNDDAMKVTGWKPAAAPGNTNEKKTMGLKVTGVNGATFQIVALELNILNSNLKVPTGTATNILYKQGTSMYSLENVAQFAKIPVDPYPSKGLLRPALNANMNVGPHAELYLGFGLACTNAVGSESFPWNNFVEFESIKVWGKVIGGNDPTGIEDVQTGTVVVSEKTVIMNGFDAKRISTYDAAGLMLNQMEVAGSNAQVTVPSAGLYFIRFESENGVATRKVLVQ